MKRNLLYYICPFSNNEEWRHNVDILKNNLYKFNNKKIVTIAMGDGIVPPDDVINYFDSNEIDFFVGPNHKLLGEVPHFEKMLPRVYSLDPCEITFYAHAKGVSPHYIHKHVRMRNIKIWRNLMYYFNLRDINYIENILTDFKCCGCFKINRPVRRLFNWHFGGTYFWFNNKALFSHEQYDLLLQDRLGVEGFLGHKFHTNDAYCLFSETTYKPGYYTFNDKKWNDLLRPHNMTVEQVLNEILQLCA